MGNHILEHCLLQGPLADKTRILVTHAVPVLKHADYVYLMENGVIAEEGEYQVDPLGSLFASQVRLMADCLGSCREWPGLFTSRARIWKPNQTHGGLRQSGNKQR